MSGSMPYLTRDEKAQTLATIPVSLRGTVAEGALKPEDVEIIFRIGADCRKKAQLTRNAANRELSKPILLGNGSDQHLSRAQRALERRMQQVGRLARKSLELDTKSDTYVHWLLLLRDADDAALAERAKSKLPTGAKIQIGRGVRLFKPEVVPRL